MGQSRKYLFQNGLSHLDLYIQQHGDAFVPLDYANDQRFQLGAWLDRLVEMRRTGGLIPSMVKALNQRGVDWNPHLKTLPPEPEFLIGLAHLDAYAAEHRTCDVLYNHVTEDGFQLGAWLIAQRSEYRSGQLPKTHFELLERRQITWVRAVQFQYEKRFAKRLEFLKAFKTEHGHANVPPGHVVWDAEEQTMYALGQWVTGLRIQRRRGLLIPERVHSLELLGFEWHPETSAQQRQSAARKRGPRAPTSTTNDPTIDPFGLLAGIKTALLSKEFLVGLRALGAYRIAKGDARVPGDYVTAKGFPLGEWLNECRLQARNGKLNAVERRALERLGATVGPRVAYAFDEVLEELDDYKSNNNGNADVPVDYYTPDRIPLGLWLRRLEVAATKGDLFSEQIQALAERSVSWAVALAPQFLPPPSDLGL